MNNHGNLSLKHSSDINRKMIYSVKPSHSTMIDRERNSNFQNNGNLKMENSSNTSAVRLSKSRFTGDSYLFANNNSPNEQFGQFQRTAINNVSGTKSDGIINRSSNSTIQTDTVKSLNYKMYTNCEIEKIHVPVKSQTNKGTKFERLRRELESLEQNRNTTNKNDLTDCKDKINRFSDTSNVSTISSCQNNQQSNYSALSEPLNYFSDCSNATSYDGKIGKSMVNKNIFLNTDSESSDNSSNLKKFKISDLKRHSRTNYSYSPEKVYSNNFKNVKDLHNVDKETNSFHHLKSIHGNSGIIPTSFNEDIGALLSNSSVFPETDIDSGTISENCFFPQTDFGGDISSYPFEKTRSLVDLRNNSESDYKCGISKAISTENFKKVNVNEECSLIKRLKSKAQSTQELRVADSLTKLNVPEWMNDFKLSSIKKPERTPRPPASATGTISFKNIKHHDSILSKYKYSTLPVKQNENSNKDSQINKIILPSTLYRSRSQNLLLFNPKVDSKLRGSQNEIDKSAVSTSSLKTLNDSDKTVNINSHNLKILNERNSKDNIESYSSVPQTLERQVVDTPIQPTSKILPQKETTETKILDEKEEILQLDRKESECILRILISTTQNQSIYDEVLCESFGINPNALKLLVNVKRKTPNLSRDETFMSFKQNENISVENSQFKKENNVNHILCNFKGCNKQILEATKIDRANCSCYNCYTYYCSKKCRIDDFSNHVSLCSYNRINKMLLKVKSNFSENQLRKLSNYAQQQHSRHGEGTILIAFESCRAADDFLNKQLNRLLSQPYYLSLKEIKPKLPLFKLMNYDPSKECIITLIICATLPMGSVEHNYPTFKHSYKVKCVENSSEKLVQYEKLINPKEKHIFKDVEARKKFFDYVINFFKAKGINLNQSHYLQYNKLVKYLNEGLHFDALKIFVKDPTLNSTIAYIISPNRDISTTVIRNISTPSVITTTSNEVTNVPANKTVTETEI